MSVSLSLCDSLSLRFSLSLTSALLPFSLSHLPSFDSLSLSLSLLSPSLLVQEHHRRRHPLHMRTIANQQPISSYLVVTIHHWGTSQKCGESIVGSFNSDKAIVFPYNEVCDSTLNLSMSLKIGQGSYGSVYLGKLRGDDVAIKQMNDTKSKEFMSELNILCRVHHTNLIKLIGYATGGDSLFLVYELAQNGALSDHLHNPAIRGFKPLPWTTRVHIALDAAKGLEYIHLYTKPYYIHRDVKSSNILLDSSFHAKMLSILENNDPFTELSQCIDLTLTHYHKDSLLQLLSIRCSSIIGGFVSLITVPENGMLLFIA
ncbi:lysM domain receptor-like kinase 3 isoform X3 [Camellia sinensis]|uniref:lysM domain receptor-like kinase 3 isoform X3 n=1 Tax=Camellia sinensis TaxID=4442 RepID=UPI001035F861|nr:lysM domain receptor-like kinase 3 isoform X3 [Camellia sinensis]XP_028114524.1 lysM domain receptor-like kinase 3 isoform X3 [Camellia sinensis]